MNNLNRIAARIAKSTDVDEISDEVYHWASYLDETLKSARVLIGKLEVLRDFLDKAEDDPMDKWCRVVALAIEAKSEIANDSFVAEAQFMRGKMHERVQKPFYAISPSFSDQQEMDPETKSQALTDAARDNATVEKMMHELTQELKKFHSRW